MKVYLDNNSSTQVDKRVTEAMEPFLSERFGNSSAAHVLGEDAQEAVEEARELVAGLINALPGQIYQ